MKMWAGNTPCHAGLPKKVTFAYRLISFHFKFADVAIHGAEPAAIMKFTGVRLF